MKRIYSGKTKDVYEEGPDSFRFVFTDRVTKNEAGEIDPGGNTVADNIAPGQAEACLTMSAAIFQELQKKNITRTHLIACDQASLSMVVHKASLFRPGLEWIARWMCTGSFLRRYSMVPGVYDGMPLPEPVFELTLKDDTAGDPLIVPSAVVGLGIMAAPSMEKLLQTNAQTMHALHGMFAARDLDLWDIKIEWGLDQDGQPLLIDEISPGSCRAFQAGTRRRIAGKALADRFRV